MSIFDYNLVHSLERFASNVWAILSGSAAQRSHDLKLGCARVRRHQAFHHIALLAQRECRDVAEMDEQARAWEAHRQTVNEDDIMVLSADLDTSWTQAEDAGVALTLLTLECQTADREVFTAYIDFQDELTIAATTPIVNPEPKADAVKKPARARKTKPAAHDAAEVPAIVKANRSARAKRNAETRKVNRAAKEASMFA